MARIEPSFDEPRMLIDGELVESADGERFATHNPATGELLTHIPRGTEADVERAVSAAATAQPSWYRETQADERAAALYAFADVLREHADRLGAIDSADSGNPIAEMRSDAVNAATVVEMFAGVARQIKGETIPVREDSLDYTLEQPYGVVGRIIAYNHPVLFGATKLAAPLIAGNTVVLKPPEQDSTAVMELGRLIAEEEIFPPGVVNIVSGFGEDVGAPLVRHPEVRKIGFIGSVPTGRLIQEQAAETVTDVLLELGGKNPAIVYPDADLETAIDGIVGGMNVTWCGQSCGSISRLFLHEDHFEQGVELIRTRLEAIEPGDPLDPDTEMGCLVSADQLEKVESYVDLAVDEGAELVCGGEAPTGEAYEDGYYYRPTAFTNVRPDMRVAQEEVFGPTLFIFEWSDPDEVIEMANDVEYGLTASIWTDDLRQAHRTAAEIEAGYVWINEAGPHFPGAPFGGWKQSGIGREEAMAEVYEFTQTKNVNVPLR